MQYYQDLDIDWSKASKEFLYAEFEKMDDLERSNYLYKNQLKQLVNWVNHYCEKASEQTKMSNIFSINGERGTGKSSFVRTAVDVLKENKHVTVSTRPQSGVIYTLPIIDPTIFNGKLNILELFISMLKKEIESTATCTKDNAYFKKMTKFNSIVKEVVETLKNMRIKDSAFAEKNSSIEALDNIQKQQYFSESIAQLVSAFLDLKNTSDFKSKTQEKYNIICLPIDDLDLVPNEYAYETLLLLENFLNHQPNLMVFVALRREQLVNSVLNELIFENRNLLDQQLLVKPEIEIAELREQATNLIDKVLPLTQKVTLSFNVLSSVSDLLLPFIEKKQQNNSQHLFERYTESSKEASPFRFFIQKAIMEQTRIQIEPIEQIEVTPYNYPVNLRSALQYLEFIHQFDNYQEAVDNEENILDCFKRLEQNVVKYQKYLLGTFNDYLPREYHAIISDWQAHEFEVRNSYLCIKLVATFIPEATRGNFSWIIKKVSSNVSLGDVYTILKVVGEENRDSNEIQYFVYALKMLYSLEMLTLLLKSMVKSGDSRGEINATHLHHYLCLAQGKIMPDGFPYNDALISGNTTLYYPYTKGEKEEDQKIVQKILYSTIAASGDVRRLPTKVDVNQDYWEHANYRWRNQYDKTDFIKNTSYYIDLFSQLTDFELIKEKLLDIVNKQNNHYLFYSLFDLDYFINKNYTRRSDKTNQKRVKYSLERVNDCFRYRETSQSNEKKMFEKMVCPLLKTTIHSDGSKVSTDFLPLFKLEEIKFLSEIFSNPLRDTKRKEELDLADYQRLIDDAKEAMKQNVREKRKFSQEYYGIFEEWPENMDSEQKERMANFISKPRSQQFEELDSNLRLMLNTLNDYRTDYMKNHLEED